MVHFLEWGGDADEEKDGEGDADDDGRGMLERLSFFFFQAEDGIRDGRVTGVQTCALPICRRRPGTGARAAVAALSVDERRGADVPLVPMGRAAARGGPARGVLRAHRSRAEPAPRAGSVRADALARVVAAVPPDVPLRNHQARERRPDVARPHRPRLPLLDPAPAAVDGVVRPLAPGMDAPRHAASRSRGGAGRAVAHLRPRAARPAAARGLRPARARAAGIAVTGNYGVFNALALVLGGPLAHG